MAKRVYGNSDSNTNDKINDAKSEFDDFDDDATILDLFYHKSKTDKPIALNSHKTSKQSSNTGLIIIIVLLFAFIIVLALSLIKNSKSGAHSAQEAAVGFVTCIADNDKSMMYSYVPKVISNSDVLIDTEGIADFQKIDEQYNITFSSVNVAASNSISDIKSVKSDIKAKYNFDIDLTKAEVVTIKADYKYTDEKSDIQSKEFKADFVVICMNNKWYVCPGLDIPDGVLESNASDSSDVLDESNTASESASELDSESDASMSSYAQPIAKDIVAVKPYKGALKDLQSGKVTINKKDYTFPCKYLDMTGLFILSFSKDTSSKDVLTQKTAIKPNYILNKLPVVFSNLDYNMTDIQVSIGNRTQSNIEVDLGDVTMFYIGEPKSPYSYQIYDYPDILLPGNISFETSLSDAEKVYGKLTKCVDTSNAIVYDKDAVIYAVQLNNTHNYLYLQFLDDKLVAIQWYYYDFTSEPNTEGSLSKFVK